MSMRRGRRVMKCERLIGPPKPIGTLAVHIIYTNIFYVDIFCNKIELDRANIIIVVERLFVFPK